MRRKSARNAGKSSPEKAKPSETPLRKSRRTSRRHRRSSSSGSANSDDETKVKVNVPNNRISDDNTKSSNAASNKNIKTVVDDQIEDIDQKSLVTSPEKPVEQKSDNVESIQEEDAPVEGKTFRRTGSTSTEEPPLQDDQEDKKGKGKSKDKHNSNIETNQPHESEAHNEREISENVQVTPESPQTNTDNPVDNEHVTVVGTVVSSDDALKTESDKIQSDEELSKSHKDESHDWNPSSPEKKHISNSKPKSKSEQKHKKCRDSPGRDFRRSSSKSSDSKLVAAGTDKKEVTETTSEKTETSLGIGSEENSVLETEDECVGSWDDKQIPDSNKDGTHKSNNESVDNEEEKAGTSEEQSATDNENKEINATHESEVPVEEMVVQEEHNEDNQGTETCISEHQNVGTSGSEETDKPKENPEVEKEDSPDEIREIRSSTPRLEKEKEEAELEPKSKVQKQKVEISRTLDETTERVIRRRKWGNSSVGLDLISPCLVQIDIEVIKALCPNVEFLEESEVKLDQSVSRDRRRSTTEHRERKKSERKVSVEETSRPMYDSQASENSLRSDENLEPEVDNSNIIAMNRKISIVDDSASKLKPPPSPARHPVSEVLYITNLVRPFTLKQLKELLERTGKIRENGFWTDRIKSKCYVQYEILDEAEATRNALHGVHWPIGNGKKLIIDYATAEDLENARNPPPPPLPPPPPPPVVPDVISSEKENKEPQKKPKQEEDHRVKEKEREREREKERHRSEHVREWDLGKENVHKRHSKSRESHDKRRHSHRSPSPFDDFMSRKHRKMEEQVPQKLMDDLFQKTKATPSIYWQPLTPEEIATKQQQRLERMAEHKRRMEETTRNRAEFGRGGPYRRRYD